MPKTILFFLLILLFNDACTQPTNENPTAVKFKKHTLTNEFISEGVAVADLNKDGKIDIVAGSYWFEAPKWTKHQISKTVYYGAGLKEKDKIAVNEGYSNSFLNFTLDVNNDGWIDVIRIGLPGDPAQWYENPKNKAVPWKVHLVHPAVGNESPAFVDVDGNGRKDLIFADSKNKKVIWLSAPYQKNDTTWASYIISSDSLQSTHKYTHGLGYFDINNDKMPDVVVREGWWQAPTNPKTPNWLFHNTNLGEECSQMYGLDLDGDGDQDVISASAHKYGIWWHENINTKKEIIFQTQEISKIFSQTHNLTLTDINGDKNPDLISGKRHMAHNGSDPGELDAAVLYWFEYKPGKQPQWFPHLVDNDSGAGLQNVVTDMNKDNLPDIVVSNKKGVYYFEQLFIK